MISSMVNSGQKPKLSIAIPTYNRHDLLMACLYSIQKQSMEDFECFVLDDGGSTDGTVESVKTLVDADSRFQYLLVSGGTVVARNLGLRKGQADILVTFDDDVELTDPETLAFIVEQFAQYKNWGVLGLSEYYKPEERENITMPSPKVSWGQVWKDTRFFTAGKINRWGWMGTLFHLLAAGRIHKVDHVRSSSMAINREAFEKVGGFFEPYTARGYGYRYETDLCIRIKRAGYPVCFAAQQPSVYHKAGERQRGWDRSGFDEDYLLYTNRNNMFFFLRNYWHPLTAWVFFVWDVLVGASPQPGILRIVLYHNYARRKRLKLALRGKFWGWQMYWKQRNTSTDNS
jgi:GT2 family glycosyltransferase